MSQVNERNSPEALEQFLGTNTTGKVFAGKVTSVVSFGAFVEVMPGVEGLLHESEMNAPVAMGEALTVRVDAVDAATRRISLTPA